MKKLKKVTIIGAGLAGSEAALYLAGKGVEVDLFEMRPGKNTPAHKTGKFAELICSNSLKSRRTDTGAGLLKAELKKMGCRLIEIGEKHDVKSGAALTVDRELFSDQITELITTHPKINVIREEVTDLKRLETPVIIASGPLTSDGLTEELRKILGENHLYFFDAISPIISRESIDREKGFFESRYGKGDSNIFNLPMSTEEYDLFWVELTKAEVVEFKDVDKMIYFESCLPVEEIAARGKKSLLFGPLRPVGFENPKACGAEAVVQLRPEDKDGNFFNIIGFQTRLKYGEQKRVFRLIPGLENAEFVRYGSMHRNTFINSPHHLKNNLELKQLSGYFMAGQITGVEGYIESIMTGLIAAVAVLKKIQELTFIPPPQESMTGSLIRSILQPKEKFQPVNANFGIIPQPVNKIRNKKKRRQAQAESALRTMETWKHEVLD